MFLQLLNHEDKEKFLELIYKIANADGEFAEEEQEIVDSYKKELGILKIEDTSDIEGLIEYFWDKVMEIRKIVYFETIGLINADEKIENTENEIIEKMEQAFQLEKTTVKMIECVAKKLQEVYDEVYDVLFY